MIILGSLVEVIFGTLAISVPLAVSYYLAKREETTIRAREIDIKRIEFEHSHRERKRDRYENLARAFSKFLENPSDADITETFLLEYNLCSLYASREVVEGVTKLLDVLHQKERLSAEDENAIINNIFIAIRKDVTPDLPVTFRYHVAHRR